MPKKTHGPQIPPIPNSTCSQDPHSPPLSPEWDGVRSLLHFVWNSSWTLPLLLSPTLYIRDREKAGNRGRKETQKKSLRLRLRQMLEGCKETKREGTAEREREKGFRRRQGRGGGEGWGGKSRLEMADLLRSEQPRSCRGEPASLAARLWPQCWAQHGVVAAGPGIWRSLLSPGPCA